MDFFQYQDAARKKTSVLVVFFILAVALIILSVYGIALLVATLMNNQHNAPIAPWQPNLFIWVTIGTTAVVLIGTLWKIHELESGGGAAIAEMLGGQLIPSNTTDLNQRKLLNVVEEMAIASGIRVPPVYLLPGEPRINAFAAGFSTNDAVIGVTQGTIKNLSRDELQGVIGHEFSHILNGDMLLNIRLMGFLNGILLLALIGYGILRGASEIRGGKNGAAVLIVGFTIGLLLMAIGWIGVFFGRMIKSAVSRQREFLADASSVQFTRNPSGITGALKKIGGLPGGSRLQSHNAEQASHLFFGNGLTPSFLGLLSTHPPLEERIRRFEPQFDGKFAELPLQEGPSLGLDDSESAAGVLAPQFSSGTIPFDPEQTVARVGTVQPEHVDYATQLVASLPDAVRNAVRDPIGAQAIMFCLLLDENASTRQKQCEHLASSADSTVYADTLDLEKTTGDLAPEARLPVIDLALPALRHLSADQYKNFRDNISWLIEADQQIRLFEFTLNRILLRNLDPQFLGRRKQITQYYSLDPLQKECSVLLSALAHVGSSDEASTETAFNAAVNRLGIPLKFIPLQQCDLGTIDQALDQLNMISPPLKKALLEACSVCVGFDGRVTIEEAELFRAVADALGCPMPLYVNAQ